MPSAARNARNYAIILRDLPADIASRPRDVRMQNVVDAVWNALHDRGVSWVGFYIDHPHRPDSERLILGPRRDKPACSPIGLHGACGQAMLNRSVLIVRDVAELGANYVACDPRDRSELVIPLRDEAEVCWGVFDIDSWEVGAFEQRDADGFMRVLRAAGLQPLAVEHVSDLSDASAPRPR